MTELMEAFGFSSEDLAANRRGELSPAQAQMAAGAGRRYRLLGWGLAAVILLAGVASMLVGPRRGAYEDGGLAAVVAAVVALLGVGIGLWVFVVRRAARLAEQVESGVVTPITGPLSVVSGGGRGRSRSVRLQQEGPGGRRVGPWLGICVATEAAQALESGSCYTTYWLGPCVLSLEPAEIVESGPPPPSPQPHAASRPSPPAPPGTRPLPGLPPPNAADRFA